MYLGFFCKKKLKQLGFYNPFQQPWYHATTSPSLSVRPITLIMMAKAVSDYTNKC